MVSAGEVVDDVFRLTMVTAAASKKNYVIITPFGVHIILMQMKNASKIDFVFRCDCRTSTRNNVRSICSSLRTYYQLNFAQKSTKTLRKNGLNNILENYHVPNISNLLNNYRILYLAMCFCSSVLIGF